MLGAGPSLPLTAANLGMPLSNQMLCEPCALRLVRCCVVFQVGSAIARRGLWRLTHQLELPDNRR